MIIFISLCNSYWPGSYFRKGYDHLLEAYSREFKPEDKVCLALRASGLHTDIQFANDKVLRHCKVSALCWEKSNLKNYFADASVWALYLLDFSRRTSLWMIQVQIDYRIYNTSRNLHKCCGDDLTWQPMPFQSVQCQYTKTANLLELARLTKFMKEQTLI